MDTNAGEHHVLYEDGDVKWHNLRHEEEHGQLRWTASAREKAPPSKRARAPPPSDPQCSELAAPLSDTDTATSSSSGTSPPPPSNTSAIVACSLPPPLPSSASLQPEYPRVILRLREPPPPPAGRRSTLPEGLNPGDFCLAIGLHVGRREQFKAKLLRVRPGATECLVRYVADVDGSTNELNLPEVRHACILISRAISRACDRPPSEPNPLCDPHLAGPPLVAFGARSGAVV